MGYDVMEGYPVGAGSSDGDTAGGSSEVTEVGVGAAVGVVVGETFLYLFLQRLPSSSLSSPKTVPRE